MRKGQIIFYILFALIVVSSIFLWLNIKAISDIYSPSSYLWILVFLIVDLASVSLLIYLFDDIYGFLTVAILPISFLAVFGFDPAGRGFDNYLFGFGAVSLVAVFAAFKRSTGKKSELVKLNFLSVSRYSKGLIAFAIIILVVGLIYSHLLTADKLAVPKVFFDQALLPLEPIINRFVGAVNLDSSIDDVFAYQILTSGEAPVNLSDLSPSLAEAIIESGALKGNKLDSTALEDKELADKLNSELIKIIKTKKSKDLAVERTNFSESFGLGKLKGDERAKDVLYAVVNNYFLKLSGEYSEYMPFAAALIVFLSLKGIFWIFSLTALIIAWFLLYFFKKFKLVRIEKVPAEKEVIVI